MVHNQKIICNKMVHNQKIEDMLNNLKEDPKVKIYVMIKGKGGFNLAQDMLNWDDEKLANDQWASQWSEQEKKEAVFLIIGKKQRVNEKIGVKLLVGRGDKFSAVGELHPKKKAFQIWKNFIVKC
jgi:hypothetical protein